MAVVTSFSQDSDFWELNPQLLLHPDFKKLHQQDKSKGKTTSSSTMWWVALCYDMDPDNKWRGQLLAEKHALLGAELLGNADFYQRNGKLLDPLISSYIKLADSTAKRAFREWEEKMDERRAFIRDTKYTLGEINEKGAFVGGTATILDTMMKNTKSLYDQLGEVLKQLNEESGEGTGKGGAAPSGSDEGRF